VTGRPLGPATIAYTELVARLTATYRANLDEVARAALAADIERNQDRTAEQGPNWLHDRATAPTFTVNVEPGHGPTRDKWMARCSYCPPQVPDRDAVIADASGFYHHTTEAEVQVTADRHAAWHQNRGW
jgi:hypothetical protein